MSVWRHAVFLTLTLLLCAVCLSAGADEAVWGVVTQSDRVNLRAEALAGSAWMGSYERDTWVRITGESDGWYSVTGPDGKSGFMNGNYVSVAQQSYGVIGIVTNPRSTSFLNLRQSPDYSARVLGIYYNGVPCVLLSLSDGWYHVRVNGVEGYFSAAYIEQSYQVFSEEVATVLSGNGAAVNLRQGPGKEYEVLRQLDSGSYVMVLQRGAGWWQVSADGSVGFMSTEFLQDGVQTPHGAFSVEAVVQDTPAQTGVSRETEESAYAIVTNPKATQVLNLRQDPDTSSLVLGQFSNGARFDVLACGEEWCQVQSPQGVTGYMMTRYLTLYEAENGTERTVAHPQQSYVNLRAEASMDGAILAQVPHGSMVTVLVPGEAWMKVRYGELEGYMVASFLE